MDNILLENNKLICIKLRPTEKINFSFLGTMYYIIFEMENNQNNSHDLIKQIEDLQFELDKYRIIADFASDWVYCTDSNGNYTFVSPSCKNITGYSPEEFYSDNNLFYKIIHPDDIPIFNHHFHKVDNEGNREPIEFRIKKRNGDYVWISHNCQSILNQNKEIIGIRGSNRPITKQKQFEDKLKEQEETFEVITNQITDGISVTNMEGKYVFANPAFCEMTGYSIEELLNMKVFDLKVTKSSPNESFDKIKEGIDLKNARIQLKRKDGSCIIGEICGKKIRFNNEYLLLGVIRDITQRVESEEALKKSESRFRDFVNHSPNIYYKFSNTKGALFWSAKVKEILGFDPEDLRQNPFLWTNSIHEDDKDLVAEAVKGYIEGKEYDIEYRIKTKSGNWIWLHDHFIYKEQIKDEIIVEGYASEITNRIEAEMKVQMLSMIVEQSPSAIAIADLNGNLEYVNEAFEKITGYSSNEVFGKNPRILKANKICEDVYIELWKTITNGKVWYGEFINKKKCGEEYHEKAIISPFFNEKKEIIKYFAIKENINSQKEAEAKLKESEARLRVLNTMITELMLEPNIESMYKNIADKLGENLPNTIILFVSVNEPEEITKLEYYTGLNNNILKRLINLIGYDPVGKKFKLLKRHNGYFKKGELVKFNGSLPDFSGSEFPKIISRSIDRILGINQIYTIGLNKDDKLYAAIHFFCFNNSEIKDFQFINLFVKQAAIVIQKKQTEISLKNSQQLLEKANKSKDKFFSIIAHDLRSPFSGLIGCSDLLNKKYDLLSVEKRKQYANAIYEQSKITFTLLENLLNWSQNQIGGINCIPTTIFLENSIVEVLTEFEEIAKSKEIDIISNVSFKEHVYADKEMLKFILRNLISNALKFSHRGGKILINSKNEKNEVFISVSDSGVGMSKQKINQLFDLAQEVSTSGTEKEKGSGLGLILVKDFVEMHKGKIMIKSEINVGTTFEFSFPKIK